MKDSKDIIEWGRIKPYFDKLYQFNSIDIETIDNELFLLGYTINGKHYYTTDNFLNTFNDFLIKNAQNNHDVLTWTRYDNTHLIKSLLTTVPENEINSILLKIGKISPIFSYKYKNFTITLENVIRDSLLFSINDGWNERDKKVIIYNLKNLFTDDLLTVAKSYKLTYYSKLGKEFHVIDKLDFMLDIEYKRMVIYSNELDNLVIIDIAKRFLENFKGITGVYPKSIFSAGSIARSYLLVDKDIDVSLMNFKNIFSKNYYFNELLDYSMKSYHGGKIESYALGFIKKAKIIDITSAYPYALSQLPKLLNKVQYLKGKSIKNYINNYYYSFIKCNVYIENPEFIHPLVFPSPINNANISPYGYIKNIVITKPEYDYLIENNINVEIIDCIVVESDNTIHPYENLVYKLFNKRLYYKYDDINEALEDFFKKIINSLYGINYELTDLYTIENGEIVWKGFRAGDFFHPIIASYITAIIRTYLSKVSYNIIENGGKVFLNMTDSIIYYGDCNLNVFSEKKILGKFESPKEISNIYILGAGRYEYKEDIKQKYTIKSRGFSVSVKNKSYYNQFNLNDILEIKHKTFVSTFKATTDMFNYQKLGYLVDDNYKINPFNLGGKRLIENKNVNLNKEYTRTLPVYLDENLYREDDI